MAPMGIVAGAIKISREVFYKTPKNNVLKNKQSRIQP